VATRLKVGDRVLVSGWGVGTIKHLRVDNKYDPENWVVVEDRSEHVCECGNRHLRLRTKAVNRIFVTKSR